MAPTSTLILLCVLLVGEVQHSVRALGYPSQGQQQDLGQDLAPGQGQGQGQGGGRHGAVGQQGSFGRNAGGLQSATAEGSRYGGSQYGGEDASRYNFRIYTEPEYYGYESKFPGGKAMFKSYRSASRSSETGLGRQGDQSEYGSRGQSAKSQDNFGYGGRGQSAKSQDNFGSSGGQQPQY